MAGKQAWAPPPPPSHIHTSGRDKYFERKGRLFHKMSLFLTGVLCSYSGLPGEQLVAYWIWEYQGNLFHDVYGIDIRHNVSHWAGRWSRNLRLKEHLSNMVTNDCPDDNKTVNVPYVHSRITQTHFISCWNVTILTNSITANVALPWCQVVRVSKHMICVRKKYEHYSNY